MTRIHRDRSQKEWLAIIVPLITGAGVAFFTIMMYFQTFYHQWIFWVFAFLFLLLAVAKLTEGFSKLLQPAADRMVIDQELRTLTAWLPGGENLVFGFDDIRAVLLKEIANDRKGSEHASSLAAYAITLKNNNGLEHVILEMHSSQRSLFDISSNTSGVAHALAKTVAGKTGSLFEDHTAKAIALTPIIQ